MTPPPQKPSLLRLLRDFSIPLLAGVLVALLWANLSYTTLHNFITTPLGPIPSLHDLTNDLFMALFFGIAAVEIAASIAPGGGLNPIRKAINPLFATIGGVVGPVSAFFLLNFLFGSPALLKGWGIPTATDIAVAWLVARIIFGRNHPAVSFLLLLAVADDAIGLAIIAIFYPSPDHPVAPLWLLLVLVGIILAFLLKRARVRSYWPYFLLGGACAWLGLHEAHLHPALALVFIVPFMPHQQIASVKSLVENTESPPHSTLMTFEHHFKPIVDFGLFFFGLCNAGVQFSGLGPITWIILLSLLLGKTLGIAGFALLAKSLGFPLPASVHLKELLIIGLIGGIGLTVALFVSGQAFKDPALQDAAKMGAIASALIAPLALLIAKSLRISPHAPPTTPKS